MPTGNPFDQRVSPTSLMGRPLNTARAELDEHSIETKVLLQQEKALQRPTSTENSSQVKVFRYLPRFFLTIVM